MEEQEYFVNINMTVKLNNLSSIRFIREAIEDGMEFKGTEGIVYFDAKIEDTEE